MFVFVFVFVVVVVLFFIFVFLHSMNVAFCCTVYFLSVILSNADIMWYCLFNDIPNTFL